MHKASSKNLVKGQSSNCSFYIYGLICGQLVQQLLRSSVAYVLVTLVDTGAALYLTPIHQRLHQRWVKQNILPLFFKSLFSSTGTGRHMAMVGQI